MGDDDRREVGPLLMRLSRAVNSHMAVRLRIFVVGAFRTAVLLVGLLAFFQDKAWADSISGYIDYTYASSDDKTQLGPLSSDIKTRALRQEYSLSLTKNISPSIVFSASGLFDQTMTKTTTDGEETDARFTLIRPYLDLKWGAYLFGGDFSYYRNQTTIKPSGSPKSTLISESYQGRLGWRPAGLPVLDLFFSHTNSYDKERTSQDIVSDQVSWTAQYEPLSHLDLRWQGSYNDNRNRIANVETKLLGNDLRADYTNRFFNDRVGFYGFYEISHSDIDVTASGRGQAVLPVLPFQGLSSLTNTPALGALDPNPFLVDGNTTVSAGINIGLPLPPPPPPLPRNIGLDFFAAAEINTLFVWIDRDQLPDSIANSFSWAVYTSSDNLNWTLITMLASAQFIQLASHFEINFPNITARYVKVVVSPLTPAAAASDPTFPDPDKIFVTEIQAFLKQSVPQNKSSLSSTTQRVNSNVHVLLLRSPDIYYDISYSLQTASVSAARSVPTITTWTLSNMLGATQRLSNVFTARATIGRQDFKNVTSEMTTYQWSATLDAVPLSTLVQTLTYSGSTQQLPERTTTANSLLFNSTAQLYKDISAFINAGIFFTSESGGRDTSGSTLNSGITLAPNKKLSMTLNYGYNQSRQSGGGLNELSTTSSSTDLSVSYTPFPALYFFADWAWQKTSGQNGDFLQNYNINWSPFQGGALQINFFYNQTLRQADNSKTTIIRPYLRWNVTRSSFLTLSYSIIDSNANAPAAALTLTEKQKVAVAEYRINF